MIESFKRSIRKAQSEPFQPFKVEVKSDEPS